MRIVWIGRLLARKAPLLALEAMAKVDASKSVRLRLIGDGPLRAQLDRSIDRLGLRQRVDLLGALPWEDVKQALLESDAMLFTSLRDTVGIQLAEAMGLGLPVIALGHQGAHDLVPAGAGVKISVSTPATTVAHIAAAIEMLYHHPEIRQMLGQNAWQVAMDFRWSRRAAVMERHYYEVLADCRSEATSGPAVNLNERRFNRAWGSIIKNG